MQAAVHETYFGQALENWLSIITSRWIADSLAVVLISSPDTKARPFCAEHRLFEEYALLKVRGLVVFAPCLS